MATVGLLLVFTATGIAWASGPLLVYVSNATGQLHPYEAEPGVTLGGLAERAGYIAQLRSSGHTVVLADAGDFMFPEASIAALTPEESSMTGMFIAEMYRNAGVAAVNVGDRDLALGLDFLTELAETYQMPLTSANLTALAGNPVFPPYRTVEVGGKSVLFLGVLSPTLSSEVSKLTGYQAIVQDPIRSVRQALQRAAGKADYVVVLSQLTAREERALAQSVQGIHLILGGAVEPDAPAQETVNNTRIVRLPDRGGVVGLWDLEGDKVELVPLKAGEVPADPDVAKRIREFEAELHQKCGC